MKFFGCLLFVILGGPLFGWLALLGTCSLPFEFVNYTCGHNAVYGLPLFGVMCSIFGLKVFLSKSDRRKSC